MIYAWIWSHLPGPLVVQVLLALALVACVLAICVLWLFPAVAAMIDDSGGVVAFARPGV